MNSPVKTAEPRVFADFLSQFFGLYFSSLLPFLLLLFVRSEREASLCLFTFSCFRILGVRACSYTFVTSQDNRKVY